MVVNAFRESFQEMIDFEEKLMNVTIWDDAYMDEKGKLVEGGNGTLISFMDIC